MMTPQLSRRIDLFEHRAIGAQAGSDSSGSTTAMRLAKIRVWIAMAVLVTSASATRSAVAEKMVPLKATNRGAVAITSFDPQTAILTIGTVTDVGVSTQFGKHTGGYSAQLNLQTGEQPPAEVTVISANGRDKYFALYESAGPDPADPTNPRRILFKARIIGGEGRFAGATGHYTSLVVTDKTAEELVAAYLSTGIVLHAHYVAVVEGEISAPQAP